ncbi:MAG: hypothetical protein IKS15_04785 [Opitutales bacterium]|nr:hypothetical protein [Opitutales bacterium]
MKYRKSIFLMLVLAAASVLCACKNVETERQKPSRDRATRSQTTFGRPANWEGGIPGMTNNAPRQY